LRYYFWPIILFFLVSGGGSVVFSAGPAFDSDEDGVVDKHDLCPDSPPGVVIDINGCPEDRDNDEVPDYKDICPDTPSRTRVNRVGCAEGQTFDSDADGVDDQRDKCFETPAGIPVNRYGCPRDSDTDMVFDFEDKCADTPPGLPVDTTGCPLAEALPLYLDLGPVFAADQRNGFSEDQQLRMAAEYLDRVPLAYVVVGGHTDSGGSGATNARISQVWAEYFRNYLIERYRFDPTRITARGFGATRPLGAKATQRGWTSNRRVVITLRQN